jgi:hypothetical protein
MREKTQIFMRKGVWKTGILEKIPRTERKRRTLIRNDHLEGRLHSIFESSGM